MDYYFDLVLMAENMQRYVKESKDSEKRNFSQINKESLTRASSSFFQFLFPHPFSVGWTIEIIYCLIRFMLSSGPVKKQKDRKGLMVFRKLKYWKEDGTI